MLLKVTQPNSSQFLSWAGIVARPLYVCTAPNMTWMWMDTQDDRVAPAQGGEDMTDID